MQFIRELWDGAAGWLKGLIVVLAILAGWWLWSQLHGWLILIAAVIGVVAYLLTSGRFSGLLTQLTTRPEEIEDKPFWQMRQNEDPYGRSWLERMHWLFAVIVLTVLLPLIGWAFTGSSAHPWAGAVGGVVAAALAWLAWWQECRVDVPEGWVYWITRFGKAIWLAFPGRGEKNPWDKIGPMLYTKVFTWELPTIIATDRDGNRLEVKLTISLRIRPDLASYWMSAFGFSGDITKTFQQIADAGDVVVDASGSELLQFIRSYVTAAVNLVCDRNYFHDPVMAAMDDQEKEETGGDSAEEAASSPPGTAPSEKADSASPEPVELPVPPEDAEVDAKQAASDEMFSLLGVPVGYALQRGGGFIVGEFARRMLTEKTFSKMSEAFACLISAEPGSGNGNGAEAEGPTAQAMEGQEYVNKMKDLVVANPYYSEGDKLPTTMAAALGLQVADVQVRESIKLIPELQEQLEKVKKTRFEAEAKIITGKADKQVVILASEGRKQAIKNEAVAEADAIEAFVKKGMTLKQATEHVEYLKNMGVLKAAAENEKGMNTLLTEGHGGVIRRATGLTHLKVIKDAMDPDTDTDTVAAE